MANYKKVNADPYKRLHMAARAGGVTIYDWDVQTGEFTMDDYAKVLGTAAEGVRLTRQAWETLLHPDDRGKVSETFRLNKKKVSRTIETEYRVRTKSGSYRWFTDRANIVERNDRGEPSRVSGVLVDISHRKTVEEALEKRNMKAPATLSRSEDEMRAMLVALRDLVSVHYLDPQTADHLD